MPEQSKPTPAFVEVAFSDRPSRTVAINPLPFYIGRGTESGNHLALDDLHISRKCAAICDGPDGLFIEDRGQLNGIFVNGEQIRQRTLADGDRIRLGTDDSRQLVFRLHPKEPPPVEPATKLRSILGSWSTSSNDELIGLRLLLEATSLLHS